MRVEGKGMAGLCKESAREEGATQEKISRNCTKVP